MKTLRACSHVIVVGVVLMTICLLVVSCASQQKSQQAMTPSLAQTDPDVIELKDSRLADMLQEGDIPEEDRGDLPWLPKRPPQGMEFGESSALQPVYFEFDKYSLTTQARNILHNHAAWLQNHSDVSVQVEGHCDERGTLEYNQVLGENRAIAVKKYLVSLGVNPDQIYTISYGELQPADPGHTEDAWAKNRRAEFNVSQ